MLFSPFLYCLIIKNVTESEVKSREKRGRKEGEAFRGSFKGGKCVVTIESALPIFFSSQNSSYLRGHQPRGESQRRRRGLRGVGQRRLEEGRDGGRVRTHGVDERRIGLLVSIPHLTRVFFFLKSENILFTKKTLRHCLSLSLSLSLARARARARSPHGGHGPLLRRLLLFKPDPGKASCSASRAAPRASQRRKSPAAPPWPSTPAPP